MSEHVIYCKDLKTRTAVVDFLLCLGFKSRYGHRITEEHWTTYFYVLITRSNKIDVTRHTDGRKIIDFEKEGIPAEIIKLLDREPPLMIDNYEVEFQENGSVQIGCENIQAEMIEKIYLGSQKKLRKKEVEIPLALTYNEAKAISDVMGCVSGSPVATVRRYLDSADLCLEKKDVYFDTSSYGFSGTLDAKPLEDSDVQLVYRKE